MYGNVDGDRFARVDNFKFQTIQTNPREKKCHRLLPPAQLTDRNEEHFWLRSSASIEYPLHVTRIAAMVAVVVAMMKCITYKICHLFHQSDCVFVYQHEIPSKLLWLLFDLSAYRRCTFYILKSTRAFHILFFFLVFCFLRRRLHAWKNLTSRIFFFFSVSLIKGILIRF